MAIRIGASAEQGILRTYASGLPTGIDGPFTLLWWVYFDAIPDPARWLTMAGYNAASFDSTNYYSHAVSMYDGCFKLGTNGTDTGTLVAASGQWYAQAYRRVFVPGTPDTYENICWWNLPTVTGSAKVTVEGDGNYPTTLVAGDSMQFGTNPWAGADEYLNGRLAGIKIFEAALTEAQIVAEATRPELVNGGLTPWALIPCPSAADLTDHSGNGRHFTAKNGPLGDADDPPYAPLGEVRDLILRGLG